MVNRPNSAVFSESWQPAPPHTGARVRGHGKTLRLPLPAPANTCNAKTNHERVVYTEFVPPLLEAKDLTKRYGRTVALDGVSFDVGEGVTALLGPNGAGKSTAMKLFLGLIPPTSGTATILGEEPYRSVEVRSRIGYMPEHESLPKSMAASEFLMHMAQVSGIPPSQARTRAADVLRHVGLAEERFRPMGEYSTGMKQRVKLAQAIVHDPVLALLDEPTAGLDPEGRLEMLGLISRTANTFGISVMLSTHLMGDVERTADSVIVLEAGALAQQGAVAKLTEETETLLIEVADRQLEFAEALTERGVQTASKGAAAAGGARSRGGLRPHPRRRGGVRRAAAAALAGAPQPDRHIQEQAGVIEREAEVFDLGYQHYTGPREGRNRARMALFENGVRTILGIGRGGKAKILPALLFFGVMSPAVVFVIILSFIGEAGANFIPGPADYYGIVAVVLFIFSAIMAPELLGPDRRDNVLPLYLVRPVTSTDYILARFLAFFVIALALVYAGQLVLQAGLILTAESQVDYVRDNWADALRILFVGIVVALFISVAPMAVAAFTTRRAYAAAFVIATWLLTTTVVNALTSEVCTSETVTTNGTVISQYRGVFPLDRRVGPVHRTAGRGQRFRQHKRYGIRYSARGPVHDGRCRPQQRYGPSRPTWRSPAFPRCCCGADTGGYGCDDATSPTTSAHRGGGRLQSGSAAWWPSTKPHFRCSPA